MNYVIVKWLKSPRQVYRIPRAAGTESRLPGSLAKKILDEDPTFLEIVEEIKEKPIKVKDTAVRKSRTRPIEKDS